MKIKMNKNPGVNFIDIEVGEVFLVGGELFMKLELEKNLYCVDSRLEERIFEGIADVDDLDEAKRNAVNLASGKLTCFMIDNKVVPVKNAEIIVNN